MTADGDESGQDGPLGEDYGGFVFDDGGGSTGDGAALPSLEQRLAPIVALLVVASLVLTGGYILFAALSGPSEDVLVSIGGSGDPDASSGPNGSAATPTSTTVDTTTIRASTDAAGPTAAGTTRTPTASTTAGSAATTSDATVGEDTATTSRTVERTTDERTDAATPTTEELTTTAATTADDATTTPTETSATTEPAPTATTTTATATPESRSPSIDTLSTSREEEGTSSSLAVNWAVSDPDGDLETVRIVVVEASGDGGEVSHDGRSRSGDRTPPTRRSSRSTAPPPARTRSVSKPPTTPETSLWR